MSAIRVAVVCSNDTHVRMFAPVITALEKRGATVALLSLDPFYQQGAAAAAREMGLDVIEPDAVGRRGARAPFYSRPAIRIWRDVLMARPVVDATLREMKVDRIVLGNDSGLIEKLIVAWSFANAVERRILVQDGRLVGGRPPAASGVARLARRARVLVSRPLRWAGMPYLASSEYGEGGAEVVCASGPRSAELLARRSRGTARVVITGQPRYDRLAHNLRDRSSDGLAVVAVCTTPFEAARLGSQPQRLQDQMIEYLHQRMSARGIRVVVRPHPRESTAHYAALVGAQNVRGGDPAGVLAQADVAIIGISTLVEEAVILGCPVLTPGSFLHGSRFAVLLPNADAFPPVNSLSELEAATLELADPTRRTRVVRVQAAAMAKEVAFSVAHSAADLVAAAILSL
jgi:hypothetical protein